MSSQYREEPFIGTSGQLLVDFKPIEEADKLLQECEKFVQESKGETVGPFVPPFAIIASNIRTWRLKRRDMKLSNTYQSLQPRIAATEKILRGIIGEVVEKKAVLRMQAKKLLVRLEECARHNRKLLKSTDIPLDETRTFVNILSSEASILKSMISFNKEVLRLKAAQEINRSPALLRWGMQKSKAGVDVDISKDEDHVGMEEKLFAFRELKQKFVDALGSILEKRGIQQSNLDNCLWSQDAIRAAIKRDGLGEKLDEDIPTTFDHNSCVDCSYGYSITCECMSHLSTLQKQAQDANKRLQALVEIRERMVEAAETIISPDQQVASRSSLSSALVEGEQQDGTLHTKITESNS